MIHFHPKPTKCLKNQVSYRLQLKLTEDQLIAPKVDDETREQIRISFTQKYV